MTVVVRQTMVDDSGVFTDGTAVNKAFIDQLYGQVDDQTHSTVNPTVKPKTITDEVIAARGAEADLAAKLATLVTTNYLLGTTDLGTTWKVAGGRSLQFDDADVAHGMTTIAPTSVWGAIEEISGTAGGTRLTGLSDVDQFGLQLYGINGGAAPVLAAVYITGAKKSGTGAAAMAAAESVVAFNNFNTQMAKFFGDGAMELTTGGLAVGFAGQAGADEVQVGDANFKLDWVSATDVRLQFDTGDLLFYDRTANSYAFQVGGANIHTVYSDGRVRFGFPLTALGGGAAPTVGTIGGAGPAVAAQNTWLKCEDSTGAAFFIPVWK